MARPAPRQSRGLAVVLCTVIEPISQREDVATPVGRAGRGALSVPCVTRATRAHPFIGVDGARGRNLCVGGLGSRAPLSGAARPRSGERAAIFESRVDERPY